MFVGKSLIVVNPNFLTYKVKMKASHRSVVRTKWDNVCDYAVCSIKCCANTSHFLNSSGEEQSAIIFSYLPLEGVVFLIYLKELRQEKEAHSLIVTWTLPRFYKGIQ